MLANVLFPAFTAPYVAMMFMPYLAVAVLISETGIYRLYNRSVTYGCLVKAALVVNVISSLIGAVIAAFLPSGLVARPTNGHSIIQPGPYWDAFAAGGFVVALILSVGIEYAAIRRWFPQVLCQETRLRCMVTANVTSYVLLLGLMLLSMWLIA